eukprot:tig00000912_g5444.t1
MASDQVREVLGDAFSDRQIQTALDNVGGDVESAIALLLEGGAPEPPPPPARPPQAAAAPPRPAQPPAARPAAAAVPPLVAGMLRSGSPAQPTVPSGGLSGGGERRNIELVRLPSESVQELPAISQLGQKISLFCAPKRSESQAAITQSMRPAQALAVDTGRQKRCRFSTQSAVQISTTADSAFWVSASGRLYRWTLEPAETPGLGQFQEERLPESPMSGPAPRLQYVACGGNFVIALTEDGALFARGNNGFGQLGQDNDMPYSQSFLRVPYEKRVAAVSAGHAFAALLSADGEVATWGEGSHGQLGHGPGVAVLRRPTAVAGLRNSGAAARSVTCGPDHAVAIDLQGNVSAWGRTGLPRSPAERLMGGAKRSVPAPVPNAPRDVVQVACGGAFDVDGHTALLTARGEVYSFGRGAEGQLGHHYKLPEAPCGPAHMDGGLLGHVTHVACTAYATYLRNERGQAFRWGLRQRGVQQVTVDKHHIADVVCSRYHAIAVCVVATAGGQAAQQQPAAVQMFPRTTSAVVTGGTTATITGGSAASPSTGGGSDSQRASLPRSSSASSGRSPKPHIPLLPLSELAERTAAAERERLAQAAAAAAAPAQRAAAATASTASTAAATAAASVSAMAAPVMAVSAPTPQSPEREEAEEPLARHQHAPAAPRRSRRLRRKRAPRGRPRRMQRRRARRHAPRGRGGAEGAHGELPAELRGRAFSEDEEAHSPRPIPAGPGPAPGPDMEVEIPDAWLGGGPAEAGAPGAQAAGLALGWEAFRAPAGEEYAAALGDEAFGFAQGGPATDAPAPEPEPEPEPLLVAATTAAVAVPHAGHAFSDESEDGEAEEDEEEEVDAAPQPPWGVAPARRQLEVAVPSPSAGASEVSEIFASPPPAPIPALAAAASSVLPAFPSPSPPAAGLTAAAVRGALNLSDLDFDLAPDAAASPSPPIPLPQSGARWPPDPTDLGTPVKAAVGSAAAATADDSDDDGGGGAGGRGGRPRVRLGGHDESDEEAADAGDEEESIEAQRGFGRWLTEYNRLLEKYPLTTKALTAAVFCSVGDVACQWLEAQSVRVPLDVPRVGRFAVVGLVLNGPSHHIWYHWLEKVIPVACNKSLLLKLAVDESVFAPFSVWAFFVLMSALEGKGPAFMAARLRSEFKHTLAADLGLWIPAQLINFKFVPSHYTALYMDAIGLGWAVYLSFAAKRSSGSAAPAHGHGH